MIWYFVSFSMGIVAGFLAMLGCVGLIHTMKLANLDEDNGARVFCMMGISLASLLLSSAAGWTALKIAGW